MHDVEGKPDQRSDRRDIRDLADQFFVDVLLGVVPIKNPAFQSALEERIEALLVRRELDACFCDDGRGSPECDRCVEARARLKLLEKK